MGLGKWILGGVCAVGAVVAAPVVLPAAGFAIASSSLGATGVGLATGLGMMSASTGAVAATAATAGAVGFAAGAMQEKKMDDAYDKGRRDGNMSASEVYEEKFRNQSMEFSARVNEYIEKIEAVKKKLEEYKSKEALTLEEIQKKDQLIEELLECVRQLEKETRGNESDTASIILNYIGDTKNLVSAFR